MQRRLPELHEHGVSIEGFLRDSVVIMRTYIFRVEIEQEEDGRWSAEVPTLPGCATWGYTKDEALRSIQEATRLYIDSLLEHGDHRLCPLSNC